MIDGLDEAGSNNNNELAVLLAKYAHRLPHWVGLLITSRPESIIKQVFSDYHPYEYNPMSVFNTGDIAEYLTFNLCNIKGFNTDTVLPEILSKCEGNFLFASIFVEGVKNGSINLMNSQSYPQGLNAIYAQSFMRLFSDEKEYSLIRKVLEVILASDKMPQEMICDILKISKYDFISFKSKIGSLLVEIESAYSEKNYYTYYSFCHKSLIDWLNDYKKSGRFFIDITAGYKHILDYFIENINKQIPAEECESKEEFMDSYIRNHIIAFFIKTKSWDYLSEFLLETDTPLFPYWRCLTMFPNYYDISKLLHFLWDNTDRDNFFNILQRYGETTYILTILGYFKEIFGINQFSEELFETYVDVVHLNGGYKDSVALYDVYLGSFTQEQIYESQTLMHYSIRKLHHSMFFAPVEQLIERALELIKHIDETLSPKDYNELLFLLGGNLGVLSGNFEFADVWLKKCEAFADKTANYDFQSRAARKRADLFAVNKDFGSALEMITRFIDVNCIPQTRYEIYLLGSLGEIYRGMKYYSDAKKAFELLLTMASDRGIAGWVAHANLALANLQCEIATNFDEIESGFFYLNKAKEIYDKIQQTWGIINSRVVEYRLNTKFKTKDENSIQKMVALREQAQCLHYKYEYKIIDDILDKKPYHYQLLFL